jgi:hypothetical protein
VSRTNKDKPSKIKWGSYYYDKNKPKKSRSEDIWHWLSGTPSWWINLFMIRPQRVKGRLWEQKAKLATDLEEIDKPSVSKKPHKYYW